MLKIFKFSSWVSLFVSLISFQMSANLQAVTVVDYVIVGAGTAGALMAKKLSDDKKTSVVVLHNGENLSEEPLIKYSKNVPITVLAALIGGPLPLNQTTIFIPQYVQQQIEALLVGLSTPVPLYETGLTIPQTHADNRELLWVIAKPNGGASSINAGIWCKGTPQLYAQWEAIAGPEWSVNRIFKTFRHLEDYKGQTTSPSTRGTEGPIQVRQNPRPSLISSKFTQAVMTATGFPFVLDYNDPATPIGVSQQMQVTQKGKNGKFRVSSATAFLNRKVMKIDGFGVDGRKLRVLFNSPATRTIWNGNTAIGVEYLQNGVLKQVYASKGVIVCAGLRSSAFLMHSGVGPQAVLQPLGIPVVYDNPNAGQGLADQPHIVMMYTSNPADTQKNPSSIFTQIACLPTPEGDPTVREIRFTTVNVIPGFTLAILDLCQPRSRGSITINSADPLSPPIIDAGELNDPTDLALYQSALAVYVKSISLVINTIDPTYQLIFPNPAILDDQALVTSFIQTQIACNQHFQSHCRMAPLDQGGVVDGTGRVYGVQNLFIADNSVNPQVMDGSPMASAYLVAENIARQLGY